jgi:transposase InsO family protein
MKTGAVSRELGLPERTVRRLFRGFERDGKQALQPAYDQCGKNQAGRVRIELMEEARQLREEHPTWGAPLILVMMRQKRRRRRLPSPRTLQRLFHKEVLPPAPPGRRPDTLDHRAACPHEVWQMDASEEIALWNGRLISWLRIVDEFSGAALKTDVFPECKFPMVPVPRVQNSLRQAFLQWGRPEGFRVDNGNPWGSNGDLPTDLALWLIGLGVSVSWNPPRQPQKNGVVERSQGVGKNWVEPSRCRSPAELQKRLRIMDRIQREEYPYRAGLSRMATLPDLKHSGRPYGVDWEEQHWNLAAVLEHLSQYAPSRRVDQAGLISIYNRNYYVGRRHHGKAVFVTLDPLLREWIIADEAGQQLRTHPADELTRERILNMDVTHRRRRPK